MKAVIRGIGSYLPERVMTNAELSVLVDTSDAWIQERTGVCEPVSYTHLTLPTILLV